ncbi:MAG: SRPBCC domain-containing protein [Chloroflexi bacterium]|nr:SRPBCC domain-containing protein [Chloroflexota bacterium]
MTKSIQREIVFPQSREDVWRALTDSAVLAEWLLPNDFEPRVGHRFTFRTQPNPQAGFDGIVHCEVLECAPPSRLAYSWAGGPVVNTKVSYRLEPDGTGTRVFFEHSGFDVSQPWGESAFQGAEFGWGKMLDQLSGVVAGLAARR